ncbi:MMPL family transporter [Streptomyces sp. NPDC059037]|uniref:MMPL family transporter n=1 Tax=Streptomyces sp. NPDC059037 TaxID=3346710 RepID=UPI0036A4D4AB
MTSTDRHVRPRGRHARRLAPAHGPALSRWGIVVARRRSRVLVVWLLLVIAAGAAYPLLQARLGAPDHTVRGSDSARATQLTARHFPALGAEQDVVVFRSQRHQAAAEAYRRHVFEVLEEVAGEPGVVGVSSPYDPHERGRISADKRAAVAVVALRGDAAARARLAAELQRKVRRQSSGAAVEAYVVGSSPLSNDLSRVQLHDQHVAEGIGVPIALVVLVLALGSLTAGVLPVVLAFAAVLVCLGILAVFAVALRLDTFVTVICTMIGGGVGIDYALFVVSRFREELARRTGPGTGMPRTEAIEESVGAALRTSGGTVAASGLIVIVALGSMAILDGHLFLEIAIAAGLVVACCVLAALTLLPALLAALGTRINAGKLPRRRSARPGVRHRDTSGRWAAWARFVQRRPFQVGLPALMLLGLIAVPASVIRLGFDLGTETLGDAPSGRGQRIISQSFAPGSVAPLNLIGCARDGPLGPRQLRSFERLKTSLRADDTVAEVTVAANKKRAPGTAERTVDVSSDGRCAHLSVVSAQEVDSPATRALVDRIRGELAPAAFSGTSTRLYVGGLTAEYVDLSAETSTKLPVVAAIICVLSLGYLLVIFRSLLLPLKAVLLNLLATAAALGLTALVFQFGHGAELVGFRPSGTLQAYLPVALFALLFGLSMDYEVFLVRRVQEEWLRSGDNARAVVHGVAHTAREITAGSAIMAAVFGSFLLARSPELKQFGFALSVAVLLDATIVRVVLVPALLSIGGRANWWLPRRLKPVPRGRRQIEQAEIVA